MLFSLLTLVATQTDVVDVGEKLSANGLYGVISVLGLTTVAGWSGYVRELLKKGKDVLAVHKEYSGPGGVIETMRNEWRSEFKDQHDKNTTNWDKTATAVTELRLVIVKLIASVS